MKKNPTGHCWMFNTKHPKIVHSKVFQIFQIRHPFHNFWAFFVIFTEQGWAKIFKMLLIFCSFVPTINWRTAILQMKCALDQRHHLTSSYDPTRVVVVLLSEKKLLRRNTCPTLTTRRMIASPIDQYATLVFRSSALLRPCASLKRKWVW